MCLVTLRHGKGHHNSCDLLLFMPLLSHPVRGAPKLCQYWTPLCLDFRHSSGDLSPQGTTSVQWVRLWASLTQSLWGWYFLLSLSSLPSSSGTPGIMSLKNFSSSTRQEEPLMSDSSAFPEQNPWRRGALTFELLVQNREELQRGFLLLLFLCFVLFFNNPRIVNVRKLMKVILTTY